MSKINLPSESQPVAYLAKQKQRTEDHYNISEEELMGAQRSSDQTAALFSLGVGSVVTALSLALDADHAALLGIFGGILLVFGSWIRIAQGNWAKRVKKKSKDTPGMGAPSPS